MPFERRFRKASDHPLTDHGGIPARPIRLYVGP